MTKFEELVYQALAGAKRSEGVASVTPVLPGNAPGPVEEADTQRMSTRSVAELIKLTGADERTALDVRSQAAASGETKSELPQVVAGLERIVAQQTALRPIPSSQEAGQETTAGKSSSTATTSSDGGVGQTILRTAGMVTGLGPLIAGLVGLFGGGGGDSTPVPPQTFALPERIDVAAGLDSQRRIAPLAYRQDGSPYAVNAQSPQPKIEITVQAMDSRSFMDHSDDIARAVQQAMLRSHPLNDVISEL